MNETQAHLVSIWNVICQQVVHAAPKFILGIIIFLIACLIGTLAKFCIIRLSNHAKKRQYLYRLLGSTAMLAIFSAGLVTALGTMGINVSALIASLGLVGFAIGFALKDALSNLMSGFMVLFYEPFKEGDFISVNKVEGEVFNINLRYTIIKNDNEYIYIPNSTILSNPLTVKKNYNNVLGKGQGAKT